MSYLKLLNGTCITSSAIGLSVQNLQTACKKRHHVSIILESVLFANGIKDGKGFFRDKGAL